MTNAALDATLQTLEAERTRRLASRANTSLIDWVKLTSTNEYDAGWVHTELCETLEWFSAEVAAKRSPRLQIAMPPRAGKSHIVSQRYPVHHMARHPGHEIVCASYGAELAEDHSRAARAIAQDDYLNTVFGDITQGIHGASDRVNKWMLPNGASYTATGVGGPLTGKGFHIGIIDDPFKDRQDADSPTMRRRVWRWYLSTFYTRLAPGGGIIIMNTRWHPDDLSGHIDAAEFEADADDEDVDRWRRLIYPAIAEEDEPHRKRGEALHPARFDLQRLAKTQKTLGPREWEALYQQRPVPDSGGQIQEAWFVERYSLPPESMAATMDEVWVSVDAAKKGNATNDMHAIHVWGRLGPKRYLLARHAERWGYPEFERALDAILVYWRAPLSRGGGILIEDTANGATYLQVRGPIYLGVPLVAFTPGQTPGKDKSKGARAVYLERAAESGAIVLPDEAMCPWVGAVVTWWCAFPLGKHDDDVDAASQILMRWALSETTADVNAHLGWLRVVG